MRVREEGYLSNFLTWINDVKLSADAADPWECFLHPTGDILVYCPKTNCPLQVIRFLFCDASIETSYHTLGCDALSHA